MRRAMTDSIGTQIASLPPSSPDSSSRPAEKMWADGDGPSFSDLLDIINPLQHLPVISTIYRAITGDDISLGARIAGGALYGGPLGVILTGATAALEEATGATASERLAALFHGGDTAPVAVAAAPAATPRPAAATAVQTAAGTAAETGAETGERAAVRARLEAQRAQARLLFARLAAASQAEPARSTPAASASERRPARPKSAGHPLIPPANAPPDWYFQAMERAYRKYQSEFRGRTRGAETDTGRRAFATNGGTI